MSKAIEWLESVWVELDGADFAFRSTKGYFDSRLGCVRAMAALEKGQDDDGDDTGEVDLSG